MARDGRDVTIRLETIDGGAGDDGTDTFIGNVTAIHISARHDGFLFDFHEHAGNDEEEEEGEEEEDEEDDDEGGGNDEDGPADAPGGNGLPAGVIEIKIGRIPGTIDTYVVPAGTTVAEALALAERMPEAGETVRMNGMDVRLETPLRTTQSLLVFRA